jgi:hypothetical protein
MSPNTMAGRPLCARGPSAMAGALRQISSLWVMVEGVGGLKPALPLPLPINPQPAAIRGHCDPAMLKGAECRYTKL